MKKITITFKSNKPFTDVRSILSIIYHIHTFLANFEDACSHKITNTGVKSGIPNQLINNKIRTQTIYITTNNINNDIR